MTQAYLWHVIVVATGALLWRRFVGQGPLEWLTQKVSRGVSVALVPMPAAVAPRGA
jgi:uncharacterized membrane protein YeiB